MPNKPVLLLCRESLPAFRCSVCGTNQVQLIEYGSFDPIKRKCRECKTVVTSQLNPGN